MKPYYADDSVTLHHGDSLEVAKTLEAGSVDCIVTSPPYFGLRDYGEAGQYGLEASPAEYVETMRALFSELRRVLADDGTLWLNLGDSYGKDKNLLGTPWRVSFALQRDGWILRNAITWHKPNALPTSVKDRLKTVYEFVFLFAKGRSYWFDLDAIRADPRWSPGEFERTQKRVVHKANRHTEGAAGASRPATLIFNSFDEVKGGNPGDVWEIPTEQFLDAHFAVMPATLAERCIQAGCKPGGTVLDPFNGSGTTGLAAAKHGRKYVGIDLNREYLDLSLRTRLAQTALFDGGAA